MKSMFIAAIFAVACSGVATARDLKDNQKTAAPSMKAQVMSDAEMDRVTAGTAGGLRFQVENREGIFVLSGKPNIQAVENGFQGKSVHAATWVCAHQGCQ